MAVDEVVKAPFVKGAKDFLETHASEYRCYVVTATPQEEIGEILRKRYIDHYFQGVQGAPTNKADAVKQVLEKEKIKYGEAVYIGDALTDYNAAKDNSVTFIALCEDK